MQGMPGALQVLAVLHGVQTIHRSDTLKLTLTAFGALKVDAIPVSEATAAFQAALLPHELWVGPLPVCLAEHHEGRVRRLRLVLATKSDLLTAEAAYLQDGPHLPGHSARLSMRVPPRNGLSFRMVGSQKSGGCSTRARIQADGAV